MTALVKTPWNRPAKLVISDKDGFTSHLPSPDEFDSTLEESFAKKFGPEHNGWQLIREGEILHDRQRTFVPDFTFRHTSGNRWFLDAGVSGTSSRNPAAISASQDSNCGA